MPRGFFSLVPLVDAHELRRDLADRVAAALPFLTPADTVPLRRCLPRPVLDLLWACGANPEREDLMAAARLVLPNATGLLLVAEGVLREVASELGAADALSSRLRRLASGEALRSDDWLIVAFDDRSSPLLGWIGDRTAMVRLLERLRLLADQNVPVLLLGETGTGKEVVARGLHRLGRRAAHPWMAINCAGLPESLLESELFGCARGAFTGAVADRPGLLETAGLGTVFLDEVGELPLAAQAKLLRVLEEHRVRRIGASETRALGCRIVAATNRDLVDELGRGRFRADLLFRLRGAELRLPPLRDRRDDILPLAEFFLAQAALRFHRPARRLSAEARLQLLSHPWPGNVRELRQALEAALLAGEGDDVSCAHLNLLSARPLGAAPAELLTARAAERAHILRALASTSGNKMAAARLLGLTRQSLQRRLARHGIGGGAGNGGPEMAVLPGSGRSAGTAARAERDGHGGNGDAA